MNKHNRSIEKNEGEEDIPMDPLIPQAPKEKQDSIKKKPYSPEKTEEKKQRAEADRYGEQSVRSGLV
jgi:hypothetical protein